MRLGSRWRHGTPAPAAVPAVVVHAAEHAVPSSDGGWWTLTWLEGRPVIEHDDGVRIRVTGDGEIVTETDDGSDPAL